MMRSPAEMVEAAIEQMLNGREPDGREDQMRLMNFLAFNIDSGVAGAACLLMKTLYPERLGLLTDDEIERVVAFQTGTNQ